MILPLLLLLLPVQAQEKTNPWESIMTEEKVLFRAWLDSPGGELPFFLEFRKENYLYKVDIINGTERLPIEEVRWNSRGVVLVIPHYDSRIEATFDEQGQLHGLWRKRTGLKKWSELPFHMVKGSAPRFQPLPDQESSQDSIEGRWTVHFSSSAEPAVGVFRQGQGNLVEGTFLTTTGDYRFLAGSFEGKKLRLSCFDGAHAFLFHATLQDDGTIKGDFWSRDSWHETWSGNRDAEARLPDAFSQTTWTGKKSLAEISFPDLRGQRHSLDDPAFSGKARIIQVFGTWCPNCNDATQFLKELDRKYRSQGLSILGLAFEVTGDFKRDAAQVKKYKKHHGVDYPILIAGLSDKKKASRVFPVLDRVRSYPTTIFLDRHGKVRAVHSGFTGPATGEEYQELRQEFIDIIEELLEGKADRPQ